MAKHFNIKELMANSCKPLAQTKADASRSKPHSILFFSEEKFLDFLVTNQLIPLPQQDTSTKTMTSYAVINQGENPAIIRTEISPNSIDFAIDREDIVPPNTMRVFVPNRFLKRIRLLVSTEEVGSTTFLDVYFQSQTITC